MGTDNKTKKVANVAKEKDETKNVKMVEVSKNTQKVEKENVDVDALIAESVAKAVANISKKYEGEIEKIKSESKPSKKSANRVPDDTEIILKSNVEGKFIVSEKKGKSPIFAVIGFGDEVVFTYGELRGYFNNSGKIFLEKGKLIIEEVLSDDYGIKDIVKSSKIRKLYEGDYNITNIPEMLEQGIDVLRKFLEESPQAAEAILESAYSVYKDGNLNDYSIIEYLRSGFENRYLFTQ